MYNINILNIANFPHSANAPDVQYVRLPISVPGRFKADKITVSHIIISPFRL